MNEKPVIRERWEDCEIGDCCNWPAANALMDNSTKKYPCLPPETEVFSDRFWKRTETLD